MNENLLPMIALIVVITLKNEIITDDPVVTVQNVSDLFRLN